MVLRRFPLVFLFLLPLVVLAQPKAKPAFRDKEAALKLFASEFVAITPGKGKFPAEFEMGTAGGPKAERPARTVKMKRPFGMARYEVTQELYQAITGKNPAKWKGPRNSVEMLTHHEANEFCQKATAEMRKLKLLGAGEEIRLPTEAEWEYCCRAGTKTPYSFGDGKDIGDYCWYAKNAPGNDPPVGSKEGNAWGLHEMHGYVWEWVQDGWHDDYKGAPAGGSAWREKDAKRFAIRGGGFNSAAERCRSAAREGRDADFKSDALGFRCVRAKTR
jgi:formylglycine-generating enzyme required for sulfatase activity